MAKSKVPTIGIGVTEHNRPEIYAEFMKQIKKYMPPNAKLVVVDDASEKPVKGATFRFEKNVGIARAKNKCLELLQDCDHIFLFDSDCWPQAEDWWKPYVEGKEPHYCYIFKDFINQKLSDCIELYRDNEITAWSHARGCMLYIDKSVLKAVGGMDTNYKRWGYEHVDWSNRIYNVGLTQFRYQDIPDSNKLIYSADEHQVVKTTVPIAERQPYLIEMADYFRKSYDATHFAPFVEVTPEVPGKKDVVIAIYFTSQMDTQRNVQWTANPEDIRLLAESVAAKGQELILLHDCFSDDVELPATTFVHVGVGLVPYFQRQVSVWKYLRDHGEINRVWVVDATDVQMLRNPFEEMESNKIYVGSETTQLYNNWMIVNHRVPFLQTFFRLNARKTLLNSGILGGSRKDVMDFLRAMNKLYFDNRGEVGRFEMGIFNYVARTNFAGKFSAGEHVNTKFKLYERHNQVAWWKHK